ncbi:YoaK family protein, partial [Staphylococcus epidermidis]
YIDAYTFLSRGGTLAAGQTGNIIFLASEVSHRDLTGGILKIASVVSFMIGVMFVSLIHHQMATRYWRLVSLLPITISCLVVGFLPISIPNL